MQYNDLIADANTAFGGGDYEKAMKYAKEAIKINPKGEEGYNCAGKACMALDRPYDATEYYEKMVALDKKNGNAHFFLGYAQALCENLAGALRSLTRSLENDCDTSLKGQIYKMMAMINIEQEDYENAIVNLEQSESFLGIDYEVLQQKATCYSMQRKYKKAIFVLNQMKLLQPIDYRAYSVAFNIFIELEIYDEALAELERAEQYSELTMQYYFDRILYTMVSGSDDDSEEILKKRSTNILKAIDEAMVKGKPTAEQVFELYLRAAQVFMSLNEPKKALRVLDRSLDPVLAFNESFKVSDLIEVGEGIVSEHDSDVLYEEDEEAVMQERWDNGEFDDLREDINDALFNSLSEDTEEIEEEVRKYLSPMDVIKDMDIQSSEYKIEDEFLINPVQYDILNLTYVVAYEALKDYDSMLQKARALQTSPILANQYSGIYYELKVGKYTKKDNWEKKYKERINFWTKRMLQDPTDYLSAGYRVRSYMDIGDFESAEQLCDCLPANVKEPLMDELHKLKSERGE